MTIKQLRNIMIQLLNIEHVLNEQGINTDGIDKIIDNIEIEINSIIKRI